jgi:nitroreductase
MELTDAIHRRRMVRAFQDRPLPPGTVERLVELATHAPSAGFSQGWAFVVLEGRAQTDRYWDVTLPAARRPSFPWPGLLAAPALIIPVADADAYVTRYAEPDKASRGLGRSAADWPMPYWLTDTAMAAMLVLLGAVDADLGALFFGIFDHQDALMAELGVPQGLAPIGTIALGYPAPDRPSASQARGRRPVDQVIHRGSW